MGRATNILKKSDITVTPIKLNYSQSYFSNDMSNYGIFVYDGVNIPISEDGSFTQEYLNYASARQLYYKNFITGSFLKSSSIFDDTLQSTAASGTFDNDYRLFPTDVGSTIKTISIPTSAFGENISKNTFNIVFENYDYNLIDDGNGNIIDSNNSNTHVGNILYSQGMIIITNEIYVPAFTPLYNNFLLLINNIVNISGSIEVDKITVGGEGSYNPFTTNTGLPSTNEILPGLNSYELEISLGSFPTSIEFKGIENTSTSSFGAPSAIATIFDNTYPIGSVSIENRQYAWNTNRDTSDFSTQPLFIIPDSSNTPILEIALVPIVRQCVTVVFNHFNVTLNSNARVVIYDSANPSSIFFDKTIGDIIDDDIYAYTIQSPVYTNQQLVVDISNVTRSDDSSSVIRIFSRVDDTGSVEDVKFVTGLKNAVGAFSFPINYATINIQLEYANI